MGTLFYGDDRTPLAFDDRVLAHLRAVISVKLRRGESFTVSGIQVVDEPPPAPQPH